MNLCPLPLFPASRSPRSKQPSGTMRGAGAPCLPWQLGEASQSQRLELSWPSRATAPQGKAGNRQPGKKVLVPAGWLCGGAGRQEKPRYSLRHFKANLAPSGLPQALLVLQPVGKAAVSAEPDPGGKGWAGRG